MHRIWTMVNPLRFMIALYTFLGVLAFLIHFLLLSTDKYNWLNDGAAKKAAEIISSVSFG